MLQGASPQLKAAEDDCAAATPGGTAARQLGARPIFDARGRPVGWLEGDVIYDRFGRCRAFLRDGNVFSYLMGLHLGEFVAGYFWDRVGLAVAFVEGAAWGPKVPGVRRPANLPHFLEPPAPARPAMAQRPPQHRQERWSALDFESFLGFYS
mgnify:CR=1